MVDTKNIASVIHLEKADLTLMEIEAIVFYAQHNLVLGSGFGNAIAMRGGSSIQDELKTHGTISTGEAVITSAGELKSNYIIHAVGPRFRESDIEEKLIATMQSVLKIAEENKIRKIGFPPMGTGFYGIPLDLSARVMFEVIRKHLAGETVLEKVVICFIDQREYKAFQEVFELKEDFKD
jgi:O-acetyl-ADP-ribose deacetylase (regulator of RNase III)